MEERKVQLSSKCRLSSFKIRSTPKSETLELTGIFCRVAAE